MEHTFHTRHDFTPELGWAAYQLLGEMPGGVASLHSLSSAAALLASPLARREDLRKLLRSMEELGLVVRGGDDFSLTSAGRTLALSAGRYQAGFVTAVHTLYAWTWMWSGDPGVATPSWSYRRVCRAIREAGTTGIEPDAVVAQVVTGGARFGTDRVSFSRASVGGVTSWLKAQLPALVETSGGRVRPRLGYRPGLGCVRYQVAALCRLGRGTGSLTGEAGGQLADSLLIPPTEVASILRETLESDREFHLLAKSQRVVYRGSQDPFLDWIVHGDSNLD